LEQRSKADLIVNGIVTVVVVIIVGAALSTPFYGFAPVLIVSCGLLAVGCVLGMLGGDSVGE
jgi:hypothetical protein